MKCIQSLKLPDRRQLFFDAQCPGNIQKHLLLDIMSRNQDTWYGKQYGFSEIAHAADFKRLVPVIRYADMESCIEDIQQGKPQVLTQEPVQIFARTSGTTGQPKLIPMTSSSLTSIQAFFEQWLAQAWGDHPSLFDGAFLCVAGSATEGVGERGIPHGSASGIIFDRLPTWLQALSPVPSLISDIDDYAFRSYLIVRLTYEQSLSFIATPNPLTLMRLAETALEFQEEIIQSIHDGNIGGGMTSSIPAIIRDRIKPNPKRAAFLQCVQEKTGQLLPRDCWPDLQLIGCWLGGSIGFYAEGLEPFYGDCSLRDLGYMASEGCMSLPIKDGQGMGVLALHQNYYEFIPEAEIDVAQPPILGIPDLEVEQSYEILITNHNGLYRYRMGDLIKVEDYFEKTPIISFQRKLGHVTNLVGEKLHLNHCLTAMSIVQGQLALAVKPFRVVSNRDRLRYEILATFPSVVPTQHQSLAFLQAFDQALCSQNIEYAAKRKSNRLQRPCLHVMDTTWEKTVQQGVQTKWIALAEKKTHLDIEHIQNTIEWGADQ